MTCREAAYSEQALDYIVSNYPSDEVVKGYFQPDCYLRVDEGRAIIYLESPVINSKEIERLGFASIPNVYGLMSELALENSGVLRIRRQPNLDLYGQGVLVGIVDTGIDFTHQAFIQEDGTTRILSLWDQSIMEGDGTEEFPFGQVYTREDINQALQLEDPRSVIPSRDDVGHGTFLAGVAAGRENRQQEFSGVAPLAELVVVKCKQAKNSYREYYGIPENVPAYQENDILMGLSYIIQVARRERKSVAICLGMGTNMGSHDGETKLALFLNQYAALRGISISCSIGNEGNARHHHHIVQQEDEVGIVVEGMLDGFMSQLWWRTPGTLSLDVVSPSGEVAGDIQAIPGDRYRKQFLLENTTLEIFFGLAQLETRSQVVVFRFLAPKTGIWKIRLRSTHPNPDFHMWLPIRQFLPRDVYFQKPDPETTLCNPSCSENVVTVAAYNVRDEALYFEGSRGFTPSGRIKPDVTAPGVEVTGTFPRGRYGTMTGTSVAAAFVTGINALFMQQYLEAGTGFYTKELLIRGAVGRGDPVPNQEWGYGTVDAYRSLLG